MFAEAHSPTSLSEGEGQKVSVSRRASKARRAQQRLENREEELRNLFSIQHQDKLLDEWMCALQKKILLQVRGARTLFMHV